MSFKEKVKHVKAELIQFLIPGNTSSISNSIYKAENGPAVSYEDLKKVLNKVKSYERLYSVS